METEEPEVDVDAVAVLSMFPLVHHCQMSLRDVAGCGIGSYGKWNDREGGGRGKEEERRGEGGEGKGLGERRRGRDKTGGGRR